MIPSAQLIDGELLLRPFQPSDSNDLYRAVNELLTELKPWMSWATDTYNELTAREYIAIAMGALGGRYILCLCRDAR